MRILLDKTGVTKIVSSICTCIACLTVIKIKVFGFDVRSPILDFVSIGKKAQFIRWLGITVFYLHIR